MSEARDSGFWTEVERIFASVAGLDKEAERAALDALCGARADVRAEVSSLLAALGSANEFLPTEDDSAVERTRARIGDRIGIFTLVERLGSGGMGDVYRAERSDGDFSQSVAIKLIATPFANRESARRFRGERQILAALHHPHIVALLDGGVTPIGQAYLVMEYVEGEPLSTYCQHHSLPLRERIELFRQVCGAVQYLHQNFVVHRDLKPANILVTRDGVPKVLDFGIAKLIERQADEIPDSTRVDERVFTPNYASPEQLRGLQATPASDVYALGVVLYELLAGTRPYETGGKPTDEILQLVLAGPPKRPSRARAAIAERPYDPRALGGDLDAIVLRAVQIDPDERYASARALSDDLGRYLAGRPVEAREPSLGYVLRRLATRHKAAFATAGASLIVVLALLGVSVYQARVAQAERDRAEARFQDVRRLANSVIYEIHDSIANLPGATEARRLLVARALQYLDSLSREARDDLALKRELAGAYQRIGQVQNGGLGANLGETPAALQSYQRALAIRLELTQGSPVDPLDVRNLALLEFDLGALYRALGQSEQAAQSFQSSVNRFEQLATDSGNDDSRHQLAGAYQRLAEVQLFLDKQEIAIENARKAVAIADAAYRTRPDEARAVFAASSYQLAETLNARQEWAEALVWTRRARALLEEGLRANPLGAQQTRILLFALNGESRYLMELGDMRQAIEAAERGVAVASEASRRDPRDNWSRVAVAVAAKALADAFFAAGRANDAVRPLRDSLATYQAALEQDPANIFILREITWARWALGRALISADSSHADPEGCALLLSAQRFWADLDARRELPENEAVAMRETPSMRSACPAGS